MVINLETKVDNMTVKACINLLLLIMLMLRPLFDSNKVPVHCVLWLLESLVYPGSHWQM